MNIKTFRVRYPNWFAQLLEDANDTARKMRLPVRLTKQDALVYLFKAYADMRINVLPVLQLAFDEAQRHREVCRKEKKRLSLNNLSEEKYSTHAYVKAPKILLDFINEKRLLERLNVTPWHFTLHVLNALKASGALEQEHMLAAIGAKQKEIVITQIN
jgi:hypothetical protein